MEGDPETAPPRRSLPRRVLLTASVNLALLGLFVVLIEGLASLVLVGRALVSQTDYAERVYTEYDSELGWVSLPSADVPNAFGPGIGVRTNTQRFRADREVTQELPADRLRLVAAGDSFTFGYGVGNADAWVEVLGRQTPWLETVNMAQGGYGLDQAFLRYRRDGGLVRHDVAVLAFITNDFRRMEMDRFLGYDKPFLSLDEAGGLVVRNVPVPRRAQWVRGLLRSGPILRGLRSFELARSWFTGGEVEEPGRQTTEEIASELQYRADLASREQRRRIVRALVAEFARVTRAREAFGVLLYLPTRHSTRNAEWRSMLGTAAGEEGLSYVDLIGELERLPSQRQEGLFLSAELAPDIQGHYTPEGNAWVARLLPARLRAIPQLRERAARRGVALSKQ